jgi:ribosomal protein S18 acetylase RimI-like enzyme
MSILVRLAREADIAAMSLVLTSSITQLCSADHDDDPEKIARWTANKTPAGIAQMLAEPDLTLFVGELDGEIAAVGAVNTQGEIGLNYVAPEAQFRGVSKALLAHMETHLAASGFATIRLKSTKTAQRFYRAQGWEGSGEAECGRFIDC